MAPTEKTIAHARAIHYLDSAKRAHGANLMIAVDRYVNSVRDMLADKKMSRPEVIREKLHEFEKEYLHMHSEDSTDNTETMHTSDESSDSEELETADAE